jgi:aminopeptidase N
MNKNTNLLIAALFALVLPLKLNAESPFNFATTPGKLPKNVVPISYDIQLKPNIEKRAFAGSETVALDVRKPAKTITLNANTIAIASAKLLGSNGQAERAVSIAIDAKQQIATLTFQKEIAPGAYQLSLDFSGTINQSGQGLFYATYQEEASGTKKTMLGTQMEANDARRLFPCWDEPAFRAKFRLTTTVPANFTAISICRSRARGIRPRARKCTSRKRHRCPATWSFSARASWMRFTARPMA